MKALQFCLVSFFRCNPIAIFLLFSTLLQNSLNLQLGNVHILVVLTQYIYIRTVSWIMCYLGRATCTIHLISA